MTVDVKALVMPITETTDALSGGHRFSIASENIRIELKVLRKIA